METVKIKAINVEAYLKKDATSAMLKNIVTYVLLSLFGMTMLIPFLWMVSTSLKDTGAIFSFPPKWIPSDTRYFLKEGDETIRVRPLGKVDKDSVKIKIVEGDRVNEIIIIPKKSLIKEWKLNILWGNYVRAWKAIPFGRGYINSLILTLTVTIGQVLTSSMAAYAFARLQFPGRDKLFLAYLSTLMIPGVVTLIPVFILFKVMPDALNSIFHTTFWTSDLYIGKFYVGKPIGIDSYFALIMPGLFTAYGTFMLRQFFMGIPVDLEDAAKIDGCSLFGIYLRIILPLSKPALATLVTFTFMGQWKNFMWPLIVANSQEMMPLPVLLASFKGLYSTDWSLLMAGGIIVLLPMIIVFVSCQKYFVEGIQLGALKG
ncbi:MAG: carbohydrate ABC transporter permease [Candidatus Ancaeobacter aquaticus]|nr:carbohydrate ABC transporter permease [Candidatus Ancaeobacter aquaticus]